MKSGYKLGVVSYELVGSGRECGATISWYISE